MKVKIELADVALPLLLGFVAVVGMFGAKWAGAAALSTSCGPGDTVTISCTGTAPPSTTTCSDGSVVPVGTPCPVPPADACPQGTIRFAMDVSRPGTVFTANAGGMAKNTVVVVALTTGSSSSADNNMPTISAAEYGGPPTTREATMSTSACNFNQPYMAAGAAASGTSVTIPFALGTGADWGYYPKLELNKTYYFNVRNYSGADCPGQCNMIISLTNPNAASSFSALAQEQKRSRAEIAQKIREWKAAHPVKHPKAKPKLKH